MPIDPRIPLAVETPQFDLAGLYQKAAAIQQFKRQNTLRQILGQPDAVDPATGKVNPNTLRQVMSVDPQAGMKFIEASSLADERQAQAAHLKSEAVRGQRQDDQEALSEAVSVRDADLKGGHTAPEVADQQMKTRLHDYFMSRPLSKEQNEADWAKVEGLSPEALRAMSQTEEQRYQLSKEGPVQFYTAGDGKTYEVRSKADGTVDWRDLQGNPAEPPEGGLTRAGTGAAAAKPQLLHDGQSGKDYWAFPPTVQGGKPRYEDLDGNPYTPSGASHIQSGRMYGGVAAAIAAAQAERQARGEGPLSEADIEGIVARYSTAQITGTADAKATSAGLGVIGKTRASVESAEGNALKEADLALSLVDKGGGALPRWLNKPLQEFKVQGLGSTDAAQLRTVLESLKNEYVKVLSTQSGVSGGMASDAARREADSFINDGLSIAQIKANIQVMRKSMANRKAALDEAYETERSRLKDGGRAPKGSDGSHEIPSSLMDQYKHIPASRKAEAKARLKRAGYDVSGLD